MPKAFLADRGGDEARRYHSNELVAWIGLFCDNPISFNSS